MQDTPVAMADTGTVDDMCSRALASLSPLGLRGESLSCTRGQVDST